VASTRRLTFATVKSDGSGTNGGPRRPAWAIEERATQEEGGVRESGITMQL